MNALKEEGIVNLSLFREIREQNLFCPYEEQINFVSFTLNEE